MAPTDATPAAANVTGVKRDASAVRGGTANGEDDERVAQRRRRNRRSATATRERQKQVLENAQAEAARLKQENDALSKACESVKQQLVVLNEMVNSNSMAMQSSMMMGGPGAAFGLGGMHGGMHGAGVPPPMLLQLQQAQLQQQQQQQQQQSPSGPQAVSGALFSALQAQQQQQQQQQQSLWSLMSNQNPGAMQAAAGAPQIPDMQALQRALQSRGEGAGSDPRWSQWPGDMPKER